MAILTVVRCDAPGCACEATPDYSNEDPWNPKPPKRWHVVDGKHFCCWPCVINYAMAQRPDQGDAAHVE